MAYSQPLIGISIEHSKNTLILTHEDVDGICAAAIAKASHPKAEVEFTTSSELIVPATKSFYPTFRRHFGRCVRYLAIVAVAALLSLALTRPLLAQQSFETTTEASIRVDGRGDAAFDFSVKYPPSSLTDFLRPIYKTMENVVESQTIAQIEGLFAAYGWEVRNPKCEISGLDAGQTLQISVSGEVLGISRKIDNRWTISFEVVDPEEDARRSIENIKSTQSLLLVFEPGVKLDMSQKITTILPKGIEIANAEELTGLGTWRIDYGGGTYEESTLRLESVEGRAAVTVNDETVITTDNITITPEGLAENNRSYTIEYVETPEDGGSSYALYGAIAVAIGAFASAAILLRSRFSPRRNPR
jgi:hypothetical protein